MVDKFKYKNKIKDIDVLNVTQFPKCRFLHFTDVSADDQPGGCVGEETRHPLQHGTSSGVRSLLRNYLFWHLPYNKLPNWQRKTYKAL